MNTNMITKTMEDGMNARQKQALAPPDSWSNPAGGNVPNPKSDRVSWEKAVREGLADKAKAQVDQLSPRIERLRFGLKQARARGEEFVARERKQLLDVLVPELERWELTLKSSGPWIGRAGKSLDVAVAATDAAVVQAEAPVAEFESARQVIARLAGVVGVGMQEIDSALAGIAEAVRARLASARQAATSARRERDENLSEIARLERELAGLGRSAA